MGLIFLELSEIYGENSHFEIVEQRGLIVVPFTVYFEEKLDQAKSHKFDTTLNADLAILLPLIFRIKKYSIFNSKKYSIFVQRSTGDSYKATLVHLVVNLWKKFSRKNLQLQKP